MGNKMDEQTKKMTGTLILSQAYTPNDCLDYRRSAGCKTLREELIDRTSHGEIPEEAEGTWWGEVTFEDGSFTVNLYYPKDVPFCAMCGAGEPLDHVLDDGTPLCSDCFKIAN